MMPMVQDIFRTFSRRYHRSPTFLLAVWFFTILGAGTILLFLPRAHVPGGPEVSFLTALFTATSAFCVTGLTVVDIHDAFGLFGQFVILVLMELGGVGIMTFASLAHRLIGRRLSLAGQAALADTLFQNDAAAEFKSLFRNVFKVVLAMQAAGFLALFVSLRPWSSKGIGELAGHAWSALFHSVSAFCNAGFSTYRDNLVAVADNGAFLFIIAVLVILGGIGLVALAELAHLLTDRKKGGRRRRPSLNSRVVLGMTAALLFFGGVAVAAANAAFGAEGDVWDSLFHSVVARTAGFNSTSLTSLPLPGCLFLCLLMFVGGSPGSCAGGVKTTSLAIWAARIVSNVRHSQHVDILGHTIEPYLVSKARIIMALSTAWVTFGVVALSLAQPGVSLDVLLFEQISALATVGLSMGLTPELGDISRIWIILSMIIGKFGPLTVALWITPPAPANITRPAGRLMVG